MDYLDSSVPNIESILNHYFMISQFFIKVSENEQHPVLLYDYHIK